MSYEVETGDVTISEALVKLAKRNGWKVFFNGYACSYLLIGTVVGESQLGWNDSSYGQHETVSVPEFIRLLKKGPVPVLKIGDYEVEFKDNGIQVGYVFVDTATVDKIHSRLHKEC